MLPNILYKSKSIFSNIRINQYHLNFPGAFPVLVYFMFFQYLFHMLSYIMIALHKADIVRFCNYNP